MTDDAVTRRSVLRAAAAGAVLAGTRASAQQREDLTKLTIDEASKRIATKTLSPGRSHARLPGTHRARRTSASTRTSPCWPIRRWRQAKELEAELAAGKRRGPLHGIPLALKDNMDTAGIRTTAASAVYADRVPTEDAECVKRLRAAGAVILGKLNMHEFAYGGTTAVHELRPNPQSVESRASSRRPLRAVRRLRCRLVCALARSAPIRRRAFVFPARYAASSG